jgi:cytoskeletal protein RodZ
MFRSGLDQIAIVVILVIVAFVISLLAFFWVSVIKPSPYMTGEPHVPYKEVSSREYISRAEVAPRSDNAAKGSNNVPTAVRENGLP